MGSVTPEDYDEMTADDYSAALKAHKKFNSKKDKGGYN